MRPFRMRVLSLAQLSPPVPRPPQSQMKHQAERAWKGAAAAVRGADTIDGEPADGQRGREEGVGRCLPAVPRVPLQA